MTCRRAPGTWAEAVARIARALGSDAAAAAAGVTGSRIRQLSNPNRPDAAVLDLAVALDVAAHRAGQGTPIADEYARRLAAAGIRPAANRRPGNAGPGNAERAWRRMAAALAEVLAPAESLVRAAA